MARAAGPFFRDFADHDVPSAALALPGYDESAADDTVDATICRNAPRLVSTDGLAYG